MKKRDALTRKQQKLLALLAVIIFVVLTVVIVWFVGVPLVRFASSPEQFRARVDNHGLLGRLAYMGMVFLQVVVAIIPGEPFEIAAGYTFGGVEGTILCMAASTAGSLAVFGLVRRFGVPLVEVFFSAEKLHSLRFLKATPKRDALFLLIFALPGTPKDLLCYFAGLTDIRFPMWLLICSLGRFPAIITSVVGGNALGTKRYVFAIIVFAVTMAISLAGIWCYRKICEKRKKKK